MTAMGLRTQIRPTLEERADELENDLRRERALRMVRYDTLPELVFANSRNSGIVRGFHAMTTTHPAASGHVMVYPAASTKISHVWSHDEAQVKAWVRAQGTWKSLPDGLTTQRGGIGLYMSRYDALRACRLQLQDLLADLLAGVDLSIDQERKIRRI